MPPLSIAVLGSSRTVEAVSLATAAFLVVGVLLAFHPAAEALRRQLAERARAGGPAPQTRSLRVTFRRTWALPLLTILLYVAHWGTVTAYLPARAEAAGADVGLFFAADGLTAKISPSITKTRPSATMKSAMREQPEWRRAGSAAQAGGY